VVREGTPAEVHREPQTEFVARFLGLENIIDGDRDERGMVETAAGTFGPVEGEVGPVRLLLRPEGARAVEAGGPNVVGATVVAVVFLGGLTRLVVETAAGRLEFPLPAAPPALREGAPVHVQVARCQALAGE
jgi:ABC-type Fe3+/spermidine/putrescine transport system ATPase subunit